MNSYKLISYFEGIEAITRKLQGPLMTPSDLEAGSKVKFDTYKRFADNFQEVVFSFETPRTNDNRDIRAF